MSFLFLVHSEHILVARRSHSNGELSGILDFSNIFFSYRRSIILQSHYPNRRSPDGRWAKNEKIGRRWHWFWQIFWSADAFFVEAPKLKVSLTNPPIFRGFVIGEASADGRPMIGRQSADFLKIFSSWYRPKVAQSSGVNRPTIARRSVNDILSKNRRQTDARYRPSFGR